MKDLPRIFGILAGGLSLFRLSSYLLNWNISKIMELIIEKYNSILEPIRFFFQPIFLWIANQFKIDLPEWWVHAFVVWLLIGAITVRAGTTVDKETGQKDKINFFSDLLADAILTLMGVFLLLFAIFTWIMHELMIHTIHPEASKEEGYVSPFKILARETLLTISATVIFFALDAFL